MSFTLPEGDDSFYDDAEPQADADDEEKGFTIGAHLALRMTAEIMERR